MQCNTILHNMDGNGNHLNTIDRILAFYDIQSEWQMTHSLSFFILFCWKERTLSFMNSNFSPRIIQDCWHFDLTLEFNKSVDAIGDCGCVCREWNEGHQTRSVSLSHPNPIWPRPRQDAEAETLRHETYQLHNCEGRTGGTAPPNVFKRPRGIPSFPVSRSKIISYILNDGDETTAITDPFITKSRQRILYSITFSIHN